jgi:peptidoglycan/LPS O-acetylase OafA/YrhL
MVKYRSEIDGLRALAVVPVIFYHAGFEAFRGGFVGVDIFFVISGYLITTLLVNDLQAGTFSILHFYERRARRILPALFLVMLACLPLAWFWLLPQDMWNFSKSLVAVSFFSSNIFFWRTSGYFNTASQLNPTIHTWSLSVEEQYYVIFPIFLRLVWRLGKRWTAALLIIVAVASLSLAEYCSMKMPVFNFYMLPTRAWELMVGALIAIYYTEHNIRKHKRIYAQAGSVLGVGLILYAIFAYSDKTPFPSFYALAPTLGAALIIVFSSKDTLAGRILSTKLFVSLGLISYSAYLWHQPLFAFARLYCLYEPGVALMSMLALVSVALAYLAWRFVERPFRNKHIFTRRQIFIFSLLGSVIFIGVGLLGCSTQGFITRDKWTVLRPTLDVMNETGDGERYCEQHMISSEFGPFVCLIGDLRAKPDGVLWGDSFAGVLILSLDSELKNAGHSFYVVSSDGCIPIEGDSRTVRLQYKCTADRNRMFVRAVIRDRAINTIVWVGAFANITGKDWETDYLIDGRPANTPGLAEESIMQTLINFSDHGKHVIFVGDTPRFPYDTAKYATKMYLLTGSVSNAVQKIRRDDVVRSLNESDILTSASKYATVIDTVNIFCGQSECQSHDAEGNLLYIDGSHLSYYGSRMLAREIRKKLFTVP